MEEILLRLGREGEALLDDGAAEVAVLRERLLERRDGQLVVEQAAREAGEEERLVEVERAVVVRPVEAERGVGDAERRVAEEGVDLVAGQHREERDLGGGRERRHVEPRRIGLRAGGGR